MGLVAWAVDLIFLAMSSVLGWFADILSSVDGTQFYLACFTVFVTVGVLLLRVRGVSIGNGEEQKEGKNE